MTNLIIFILSSIGMSHIIVDGKIFQPIRDLLDKILPTFLCEMFHCYQCSGFWCGLFCGYFSLAIHMINPWIAGITTFMCGCSGSFLSAWAAVYMNVLEAQWFNTEIQKEDK